MHPHSRYETRVCIVKCFHLLSIIVLLPSSHLFVLLPGELLSLSLLIELGTEGKYQISLWTSKSRKTKINHSNPLSGFQERLAHCGESIPGFCLLFIITAEFRAYPSSSKFLYAVFGSLEALQEWVTEREQQTEREIKTLFSNLVAF